MDSASRRRSTRNVRKPTPSGIDLHMECVEDELQQCQLDAQDKAKREYNQALDKIKVAHARCATIINKTSYISDKLLASTALRTAANNVLMHKAPIAPRPISQVNGSSDDIIIIGESIPGKSLPPPPRLVVDPRFPMAMGTQNALNQIRILTPHQAIRVPEGQALKNSTLKMLPRGTTVSIPNQTLFPIRGIAGQQGQIGPTNNLMLQQIPLAQSTPGVRSPVIVAGTYGLGVKRPPGYVMPSPVPAKKPVSVTTSVMSLTRPVSSLQALNRPNIPTPVSQAMPILTKKTSPTALTTKIDKSNWVPLDEYYYGKKEGDPAYSEEKGEYMFKCWQCNKMLYNNIKLMLHIQGHLDSEKQQNIDLSDLTQCKHCYKQFDTPFEMQSHIEKVHSGSRNVLMCRICEKDHSTLNLLTSHMKTMHTACEMPYICQLCNFRSSMYQDVVDHFKKKHDSSQFLLCLYCLKVCRVQFFTLGWGKTQMYYSHLIRHQMRNSAKKKCTACKLTFINPNDMKTHRKKDHQSNPRGIDAAAPSPTPSHLMIKVPEKNLTPGKSDFNVKSLNVPSSTLGIDYRSLRIPGQAYTHRCYECNASMGYTNHYRKYTVCSLCRFATNCSNAFSDHMLAFHSGKTVNVFLSIAKERPMSKVMFCVCGYSSLYGNKISNHLTFCGKQTCFSEKQPKPPPEGFSWDNTIDKAQESRNKKGASLLDILGLVKKQSVSVSSSPAFQQLKRQQTDIAHNKSENVEDTTSDIEIEDIDDDAVKDDSEKSKHSHAICNSRLTVSMKFNKRKQGTPQQRQYTKEVSNAPSPSKAISDSVSKNEADNVLTTTPERVTISASPVPQEEDSKAGSPPTRIEEGVDAGKTVSPTQEDDKNHKDSQGIPVLAQVPVVDESDVTLVTDENNTDNEVNVSGDKTNDESMDVDDPELENCDVDEKENKLENIDKDIDADVLDKNYNDIVDEHVVLNKSDDHSDEPMNDNREAVVDKDNNKASETEDVEVPDGECLVNDNEDKLLEENVTEISAISPEQTAGVTERLIDNLVSDSDKVMTENLEECDDKLDIDNYDDDDSRDKLLDENKITDNSCVSRTLDDLESETTADDDKVDDVPPELSFSVDNEDNSKDDVKESDNKADEIVNDEDEVEDIVLNDEIEKVEDEQDVKESDNKTDEILDELVNNEGEVEDIVSQGDDNDNVSDESVPVHELDQTNNDKEIVSQPESMNSDDNIAKDDKQLDSDDRGLEQAIVGASDMVVDGDSEKFDTNVAVDEVSAIAAEISESTEAVDEEAEPGLPADVSVSTEAPRETDVAASDEKNHSQPLSSRSESEDDNSQRSMASSDSSKHKGDNRLSSSDRHRDESREHGSHHRSRSRSPHRRSSNHRTYNEQSHDDHYRHRSHDYHHRDNSNRSSHDHYRSHQRNDGYDDRGYGDDRGYRDDHGYRDDRDRNRNYGNHRHNNRGYENQYYRR